jgi:glycosyltransferase involved in cell wall biosynthesis
MSPYVPLSRYCPALVDHFIWNTVVSVFNRVTVVTTPTETAAQILRRQKVRVPVQAISCGVDLAHFCPDPDISRAEIRQRCGLDPQRVVLLFVGRLAREKRIEVLLEAIHRLDRDDLQLAIAGSGKHERALRALAGRLALDGRVVFTGFVPADKLPALLNSVDLFAIASDSETQSIATLEAMATGRPVLAADARALPELVQSGLNGYLFRAGDVEDACRRITQLAGEKTRWALMGAAGRAMARRHSLESTVRSYEALYRHLSSACRMAE